MHAKAPIFCAILFGFITLASLEYVCNTGKDGLHTERFPKLYQAIKDMLTSDEITKIKTINSVAITSVKLTKPAQGDIAKALYLGCDSRGWGTTIDIHPDSLLTQIEFTISKQNAKKKSCKADLTLVLVAYRGVDEQVEKNKATIEDIKFDPIDCKNDVGTNYVVQTSLSNFRKPLEKYYTEKLVSAIATSEYYSHGGSY